MSTNRTCNGSSLVLFLAQQTSPLRISNSLKRIRSCQALLWSMNMVSWKRSRLQKKFAENISYVCVNRRVNASYVDTNIDFQSNYQLKRIRLWLVSPENDGAVLGWNPVLNFFALHEATVLFTWIKLYLRCGTFLSWN